MSNVTTGSYLANVAMIGGISIDDTSKKFEHLIGGGDDADSVSQLLSGFSGSASGSVIAALNHVYEEATTGQVSTSGDNTFTGDNTFSGKLTASNGLQVSDVVLPNADSDVNLGADGTAFLKLFVDDIDLNGAGRIDLDADADTSIRASADDIVTIEAGGSDRLHFGAAAIYPETTDEISLGTSAKNFSDLFLDSGAVINFDGGDVTMTHAAGKVTFGGDGAVEIDFNNHEMTNVDVNSGAIDGTNIGANSRGTAAFTTLDANGNVTLGSDVNDVVTVNGEMTASQGILIADDKVLAFGAANDATFEYDEDGNDVLLYSGANMRFGDDIKLEFGDAAEGFIQYDESSNDALLISGHGVMLTDSGNSDGVNVMGTAGFNVAQGALNAVGITSSAGLSILDDDDGGSATEVLSVNSGSFSVTNSAFAASISGDLVVGGTLTPGALSLDGATLAVGSLTASGGFLVGDESGSFLIQADPNRADDVELSLGTGAEGALVLVNTSTTFGADVTASAGISLGGHIVLTSDAAVDIGTTSNGINDLHLGSGGVVNFDGGDVTMTHSSNLLSVAGGNTRVIRLEVDGANDYIDVDTDLKVIAAADIVLDPGGNDVKVDGNLIPNADNGGALGASGTEWSDLFLHTGAVINFEAGDVTITHSSNQLAFEGGAVTFDGNVTLGDAAADVTTVTGLLSASQDITLASDKDVNFQGGGGPVLYDSEDGEYYRIEIQGGLLVLNAIGDHF